MLPKRSGERDEAVLGREPRQAARDGRGGVHDGGDRHVQGRRHDPRGPFAGMLHLLPSVPRTLTVWSQLNLIDLGVILITSVMANGDSSNAPILVCSSSEFSVSSDRAV